MLLVAVLIARLAHGKAFVIGVVLLFGVAEVAGRERVLVSESRRGTDDARQSVSALSSNWPNVRETINESADDNNKLLSILFYSFFFLSPR